MKQSYLARLRAASLFTAPMLFLLILPAAKLIVHLIAVSGYGVHGDEPYYLAPIYPSLFAAGAITAPLGLPLLPVESFLKYQNLIGMRPSSGEKWPDGKLPSFYANFFGWKEPATTSIGFGERGGTRVK